MSKQRNMKWLNLCLFIDVSEKQILGTSRYRLASMQYYFTHRVFSGLRTKSVRQVTIVPQEHKQFFSLFDTFRRNAMDAKKEHLTMVLSWRKTRSFCLFHSVKMCIFLNHFCFSTIYYSIKCNNNNVYSSFCRWNVSMRRYN